MKFGISTFVNDDTIDPVSLARAIEERGFESLVIAEHTHIPASRESPYPLGGELPRSITALSTRSSRWPRPQP
jgi:alkanesulfonate monooxygenase SsuD/methylene tetrahydromethanopterin reductase-like flavin-dependent oxidoreductase (luciferase family)